jgi:hypothetical protein
LDRFYANFLELRKAEVQLRRNYLLRTRVNKLIGQLLQGPAIPVRIAEVSIKNAPEILNLADLHSSLDELRTRRRHVRDDQV